MLKDLVKKSIWSYTRKKGGFRKALYFLAELYFDSFNDCSSNIDINGESFLISVLASSDFKTIFDVGANIGAWSLLAAKSFPSAAFHAFEISASTYPTTISRLSEKRFTVNNLGLSDVSGTVKYKDYGVNAGVNTILSSARFWDSSLTFEHKESSVTTGDLYCSDRKIDFIDFLKIDVEGADHLVLRGFSGMVERKCIRIIQFEYGYTHADDRFLMRDFFSLLNSNGYVVGKLWSDGVEFSDFFYWLNNFKSGPNFVAVRNDDVEVIRLISTKRPSVFQGSVSPVFKKIAC